MARIAGINIPLNKRVEVGLTYIYGIGPSQSRKVLAEAGVDPNTYVKDLTDDEVRKLRDAIDNDADRRGRPAPRALAERQAPDGDRLPTAAFATAADCRCTASARRPTRARARARKRMQVAGKKKVKK